MTDFKGTQGKWNHFKSLDHHIEVNGNILVTIHSHESGKAKFDGKLISKAPELLDTVNELLGLLSFHGYNNSTEISKAKELIKEATTFDL